MSRLALPLLASLLLCAAGCSIPIPRGAVADFFTKDYELPEYDPQAAALARELRVLDDCPTSAAFGGLSGALAGGARRWEPSTSAGLGGASGAILSHVMGQAQTVDPLPEAYNLFALALPIVATDPNKGPTVGLLPVGVFKESSRITNILAPDVTYNEIDGLGWIFRMRRSFSRESSLLLDAGSSSNGNDDYEVRYRQRRFGPQRLLYHQARFAYRTQLSQRFYGIGNDSDVDDETSYVFRQTTADVMLGAELPFHFRAELRERIVSYKVGPGRLDDVPSTRAKFPDVIGIREGRLTIQAHQIRLTYDTRDSLAAPTRGLFGEFTYELADETLGSEVGFQRFGLNLTALIPKFGGRLTSAIHFGGWLMTGDRIPFYELTQLGGKWTLRGYGQGRFMDRHGYVVNFEERFNLIYYNVAGVDQIIQVAGFVDLGRVYGKDEAFTLRHTKVAAGAAVRLVVPDSELVASIDVGVSDEGPAVFVGLDYPF